MFFPPPARYYVPLLVLIFGLATTGLDYELNLANDLARNLKDVVAEMDATGEQMARRSARQLERGEPAVLAGYLAVWAHEPWLKQAALVGLGGALVRPCGARNTAGSSHEARGEGRRTCRT